MGSDTGIIASAFIERIVKLSLSPKFYALWQGRTIRLDEAGLSPVGEDGGGGPQAWAHCCQTGLEERRAVCPHGQGFTLLLTGGPCSNMYGWDCTFLSLGEFISSSSLILPNLTQSVFPDMVMLCLHLVLQILVFARLVDVQWYLILVSVYIFLIIKMFDFTDFYCSFAFLL